MKRFFNKKATTSVVALFFLVLAVSCVNEEYELSEEKISTEVTIFQEGLSLPLGSTAPITVESLLANLDEETLKMIEELNGAYMFSMSDTYDLTKDIQDAFSGFESLESIPVDEKFSFSLSNIDLSAISIEGRNIGPEGVNISEMLKMPDINANLPKISQSLPGISIDLPELSAADLNMDLSSSIGDFSHEADVVKLDGAFSIPSQIKSTSLYTTAMDYDEIRQRPELQLLGISLPEMKPYKFEEYSISVPIRITLPKEIQSVDKIKLHKDARFELVLEMSDPLFTSGSFTPKLLINLHDLFHVDRIESGFEDGGMLDHEGIEHHIHDNFVMTAANGWKADHIYHIDSLAIKKEEWKKVGDNLVLDKNVDITLSGDLVTKDLKTTLKHIDGKGGKTMKLNVDIKFDHFMIDDVYMSIVPKTLSEEKVISFDVQNIKMPDMVKTVDYVAFDQSHPLTLNMSATVPEICKDMDLGLQTLKIEFPEGIEVDHDKAKGDAGEYNPVTRTLTYSDVKLTDGLDEDIRISRLNFGGIAGGNLSYAGDVKVTAEAFAKGTLSSKALLNSTGKNTLSVDVSVNYEPRLSDYCVHIDDYSYDVEVDPIKIETPIDNEVAELFKDEPITVTLKQIDGAEPKIVINLDYPEDIPAIHFRPKAGEGLKFDFPDMIDFSQSSLAGLNHDPETNTIWFKETDRIPHEIVLEIAGITVLPQKAEDGKYYVKDRLEVSGGVCLAPAEIHKADVDKIADGDVKVEFEASIPTLSPAEIGLDEYVINIDENIKIDGMAVELPDMISSISVSELALKDVYLDLNIDAAKVADLVGDAKMSVELDVVLPEMLKVEGTDKGILHLSGDFKDGSIAMNPVRILGLDLSEVEVKEGKLSIDEMAVAVDGSVKIKDLTVNMDDLEGKDIEVAITGGLASRGADGKPSSGIEVDRIVGKVGFEIDPVDTSVDLSELAEMLNGDNMSATLDINTFWLSLNIKTNLDVPVKGDLSIIPFYGEEAGEAHKVALELDPEKRGEDGFKIYISDKAPETTAGLTFVQLDLMDILYGKVSGQNSEMATSIKVQLNAGTDPERECVIRPSEEYFLTADYAVGVPVELGEDFSFEYRDTIPDLPEIAGQLLSHGTLGLGGKITNGLPLRLDLQLRLLDSEGNEISMKEGAGKMTIAPCDMTGAPVDTEIDLLLGGIQKNASDLSAIELVFTADSKGAAGVPIRKDSFIQVDLSARIPDGVSLDVKDLLGEGDEEDIQ